MKKIPTLFVRDHTTHQITDELAVVLPFNAVPTAKFDGTCVMYDGYRWWGRREIKPNKTPPPDFDPVQHDEVTGKTVGWVPITDEPQWRWHNEAITRFVTEQNSMPPELSQLRPWTYEIIGVHFNGDPHGYGRYASEIYPDYVYPHGEKVPPQRANRLYPLTPENLREVLSDYLAEGIVWWNADRTEPLAKIKRRDFGLPWPPRDT